LREFPVELKEFARTGRKVSEIGMGTYYDPLWVAAAFIGWRRGAGTKVTAMEKGLEAGMTLLDTAEVYGSEPLVAEALHHRKRDEVFLATKVWPGHLHGDSLLGSFNKSLGRLRTSYIDLYQVHWPNPRVPIQETMGAMEELVREGKLMHVGVSNFDLRQLEEARSALPKSELASVQLDYSLNHRDAERDILPYCNREKLALLAYYPLGHGKLVSDARLESVASRRGKTPAQVALRWLAGKAEVFPIPRVSTPGHVLENAKASGWELTGQEKDELDQKFR
jgi:diketogulonate reductase-like aldo/keto reductase